MATKAELYLDIDNMRKEFCITDYPRKSGIELCKEFLDVEIGMQPFKTKGLRGMMYTDNNGPDIILLNSNRGIRENSFVAIHEAIHIRRHKDFGGISFRCYDNVKNMQNKYLEWEANEGAAEFFMPYREFIPEFVELFKKYKNNYMYDIIIPDLLSDKFYVSPMMAAYRIQSLKYEIASYCSTNTINCVIPRSIRWQRANNIKINDISLYNTI